MTSTAAELPRPVPEYLKLSFPEPPADRPFIILNMVASADGKAAVVGTEEPLSSPVDKLVLQSLRVHADAILNGAGTARATGVNPQIRDPRLLEWRRSLGRGQPPLQAILSESASLPADARYFRRREFDLVVFVGASAPEDRVDALRETGRAIEILPEGDDALPTMVRRLRERFGIRLLLLEGGPGLNSAFFHAGLIDEFFLTIGPHVADGRQAPTVVEGDAFQPETMPLLELLTAIPSPATSEVYLHWRVRLSDGTRTVPDRRGQRMQPI